MKKSFDENEQPSPAVILTLASYKSLSQYDWHNQLVENDKIRDVMMRHVVNYKREQDYKLRINALGNLKDETSKGSEISMRQVLTLAGCKQLSLQILCL